MKKFLLLIVILLCPSDSTHYASADSLNNQVVYDSVIGSEFERDGLVYRVQLAEIGQWKKKEGFDFTPTLIAVHFYLRNDDETRKVDLKNGFNFKLFDEFENYYIQQNKPEGFGAISEFKPQQFPSLYPGETYGRIVFFEAPIKRTRYLVFSIDASGIEGSPLMNVKIPMKLVDLGSKAIAKEYNLDYRKSLKDGSKPRNAEEQNSIKIITPANRSPVAPGETVKLKVMVKSGLVPPEQVYVVSPIFVLEDRKASNEYRLRIPDDQPIGELTVVIIARWTVNGNEILLSDSITFDVVDKAQRCLEECLNENSV